MKLHALNLSGVTQVQHNGQTIDTGIFKKPVQGSVRATRYTLEGDRQVDRRYHGGVDKAIYAYPHEHYAYWSEALDRDDLSPGQFGENFTTQGLLETEVHIGDQFRMGEILVEVTQPRVPCLKLGIAMDDLHFVKTFLQSERSGFYLRVLEEGNVQAGDTIARVYTHPERVSIQYIHRLYFQGPHDKAEIQRILDLQALSKEWRKQFHEL